MEKWVITTTNKTRWMFCRGLGSISVTAGGDFIKTDENLNTVSSDFDLTCNTIWNMSDCQWLFFSTTMIPNTLPMQQKHPWIEEHTMEYFQSWIGLHRARTATLLFHSLSGRQRMRDKRQPTPKAGLWVAFEKPGELLWRLLKEFIRELA